MKKIFFDYDPENDDLFINDKTKKVKQSLDIGDFVVDVTAQNEVAGLEIMHATNFLSACAAEKRMVKTKDLENIKECLFDVVPFYNVHVIRLVIRFAHDQITMNIAVPAYPDDHPMVFKANDLVYEPLAVKV